MAEVSTNLTREQVIAVMRECGMEDVTEDAIQDCMRRAFVLRQQHAEEEEQEERRHQQHEHRQHHHEQHRPSKHAQSQQQPRRASPRPDHDSGPSPSGPDKAAGDPTGRASRESGGFGTDVENLAGSGYYQRTSAQAGSPRPQQDTVSPTMQEFPAPPPRHTPAADGKPRAAPQVGSGGKGLMDRISTTSVRGTPVAGHPRPLSASRGLGGGGRQSLGVSSPSPNHFDAHAGLPPGHGAHAATKAYHTTARATHDSTEAAAAAAADAAGTLAGPPSRHTHAPLAARPRAIRVPGYMNRVYADHLRQRVDAAYSDAAGDHDGERREEGPAPRATGGEGAAARPRSRGSFIADDELPEETRLYRHQRRFEPFVATARTPRGGSAPASARNEPVTARGPRSAAAEAAAGTAAAGGGPLVDGAKASQRGRSSSLGQDSTAVPYDAFEALDHAITGVIYAPLGSKTYLAGGFRSRFAKAPVANPRLGQPRRVTDPVRRFQQMRECWDRDSFLLHQRPEAQRRKLRWAVRQSMTEWHPDEVNVVDHPHYL